MHPPDDGSGSGTSVHTGAEDVVLTSPPLQEPQPHPLDATVVALPKRGPIKRLSDELQARGGGGARLVTALPFAWLLIFFLLPFVLVLKISVAETAEAVPPYTAIWTWLDGVLSIHLNFNAFSQLFTDELYAYAYVNSLRIAAISTALTLLVGYPMAYAIARADTKIRSALLMLVVLPFWTSFLLRVYAWIGILNDDGLLNALMMWLGLTDEPISMLYSDGAVFLGIVYTYLPFMVLPLYAALEKQDLSLIEAAYDLGCRPWKAFLVITVPLSLPGIVAGCLLVFIPAVGEFVIPDLLGGSDVLMIGRALWDEFFTARNWPMASAVTIAMLVLLVVPIMLFQHLQARADEQAKR